MAATVQLNEFSRLLLEKFQLKNYNSLPEITRLNPDAMPEKYRKLSEKLPFPRDMVDKDGVCRSFMRWKSSKYGDTLVVGWKRETSVSHEYLCSIFIKDKSNAPFEIHETLERNPTDGSRLDWAWSKFTFGSKDSLLNEKVFAAAKTTIIPTTTIPPHEHIATNGCVILGIKPA